MNIHEFEALIDGGQESDVLEFKTAMNWHDSLIKDILAMANVQDGGRIVIGIDDGTYDRVGLNPEQIATFKYETMQDQVASYADPRVEFRMNVVVDASGFKFVVIEIQPFETTPVICRRDGKGLNEGDIYYRSRSGRPSSARVKRSADMRDIIEVAIARSGRRLSGIGLAPQQEPNHDYDQELGGL